MEKNVDHDEVPVLPLKNQFYTVKTMEKILNTVNEMFKDRGYMIIPEQKWPEKIQKIDDLKLIAQTKCFHDSMSNTTVPSVHIPPSPSNSSSNPSSLAHTTEEINPVLSVPSGHPPMKTGILLSSLVYVYFTTEPKVSIKKMREYIQHMTSSKINHAIIVYAQQITPSAKQLIPSNLEVETFQAEELFENIKKHKLVPPQVRIENEAEILALLKQYKMVDKNQLPRYDPLDPVVRYYHWPLGSVIKIFRNPSLYYRHIR